MPEPHRAWPRRRDRHRRGAVRWRSVSPHRRAGAVAAVGIALLSLAALAVSAVSTATTPISMRRRMPRPMRPWRSGLNIVVGFAGLLDLGYAAFFAIGAYAYGILDLLPVAAGMERVLGAVPVARPRRSRCRPSGDGDVVHFTLSFWLMLPISAPLAAVFGVLFGAPTLRLRGDYLAIVTLGFGEIVPIVARNWSSSDQRRRRPERRRRADAVRLQLRRQCRRPYYYVGHRAGGAADLRQLPAA